MAQRLLPKIPSSEYNYRQLLFRTERSPSNPCQEKTETDEYGCCFLFVKPCFACKKVSGTVVNGYSATSAFPFLVSHTAWHILVTVDVRMVALDFDLTMIDIHTGVTGEGTQRHWRFMFGGNFNV